MHLSKGLRAVGLGSVFGLALLAAQPALSDPQADSITCYGDASQACYKAVEDNGRTFTGIYQAHKYKPLAGIDGEESFIHAWKANPLYILAGLSHAAYLEEPELTAMVRFFGGEARVFEDKTGFGYLAIWSDVAILVFRGSDDPLDMFNNLRARPVSFKGHQVHEGFRDVTTDLWKDANLDELLAALPGNLLESGKIYVTGHSLGGAMAVIAAVIHPFRQVVTFGQPRGCRESGKLVSRQC